MGKYRSTTDGLYKMQCPKSLRLCWRSVEALLTLNLRCSDIDTNHISHKGGQTSIMGKCHSTDLGLYKMQHQKLLTLCWHSVDALLTLCWCSVNAVLTLCWRSFWGVVTLTLNISPIKVANTSIIGICRSTALGLQQIEYPNSLTHRWCSVDALLTLCWCSVDVHF